MLMLPRSIGQSIKIGEKTDIKVLKVTGNQVQLDISAPKDIAVYRERFNSKTQPIKH